MPFLSAPSFLLTEAVIMPSLDPLSGETANHGSFDDADQSTLAVILIVSLPSSFSKVTTSLSVVINEKLQRVDSSLLISFTSFKLRISSCQSPLFNDIMPVTFPFPAGKGSSLKLAYFVVFTIIVAPLQFSNMRLVAIPVS